MILFILLVKIITAYANCRARQLGTIELGDCCSVINWPYHNEACVNFTVNNKLETLQTMLSIDKHILINKTLSARNPVPICTGVVYFNALCIKFSHINITDGFCLCVNALAYLAGIQIFNIPFGCLELGNCQLANKSLTKIDYISFSNENEGN